MQSKFLEASFFVSEYEINQSCVLYLVWIISRELNWKERKKEGKGACQRSVYVWELLAVYPCISLEFYRARDLLPGLSDIKDFMQRNGKMAGE